MKTPSNLLDAIKEFEKLMQTQPDTKDSLPVFLKFIRNFLRAKHPTLSLPTIEVMSIIKKTKPNVFYYLRRQGERDHTLAMLTHITIDVEQAEERISTLKKKLK
ncbi:hypothetical protein [Bacillus sp. FJAT-45350]|uniref:hypothetical protein n=1 Tax=Bacillus sp. FJAT-45350 TaxID=2011014 RepID=UPI000BB8C7B9|nr:hypothetical protein [Bacillus sp. FJAT-45350]